MKKARTALIILVAGIALTACSSLDNAGSAEYSIKPFVTDAKTGKLACCELTVKNGKEIANLEASIEKTGDDYKITLKEQGVEAFRGQAISASAGKAAIEATAKAAAAILAPISVLP